jgi:hypothetical protein
MQCRSCGTEIADKAIVCYRCGAGTTDPVRKPVPIKPGGRRPSLLPAIVILIAALAAFAAADASGHPRELHLTAMALACMGALWLIVGLIRRR